MERAGRSTSANGCAARTSDTRRMLAASAATSTALGPLAGGGGGSSALLIVLPSASAALVSGVSAVAVYVTVVLAPGGSVPRSRPPATGLDAVGGGGALGGGR